MFYNVYFIHIIFCTQGQVCVVCGVDLLMLWVNDSFKQPVYEMINQCIYLLFRNKD